MKDSFNTKTKSYINRCSFSGNNLEKDIKSEIRFMSNKLHNNDKLNQTSLKPDSSNHKTIKVPYNLQKSLMATTESIFIDIEKEERKL